MDWNRVEGNWKQLKGRAKQQWGKLTDDDLTASAGRRDELAEMRTHFGRASCDIQDRRMGNAQEGEHFVDHSARDRLRARRPGIDVAVHAALVALVAEVHLESLQTAAGDAREAGRT